MSYCSVWQNFDETYCAVEVSVRVAFGRFHVYCVSPLLTRLIQALPVWARGYVWYFYLYALTIKVPVGTLLLGAVGVAMSFARRCRRLNELVI